MKTRLVKVRVKIRPGSKENVKKTNLVIKVQVKTQFGTGFVVTLNGVIDFRS